MFFVTCGQKPDWLDETNPKLRLINHAAYIPSEYFPTFHSDTIELNLHRIPDLSERFVLFNDDMFLLRPSTPDQFFRGETVLLDDSNLERTCRLVASQSHPQVCINDSERIADPEACFRRLAAVFECCRAVR